MATTANVGNTFFSGEILKHDKIRETIYNSVHQLQILGDGDLCPCIE